jgi:radical SAM superfamily enzyme YgiQ (UPF0313 family)
MPKVLFVNPPSPDGHIYIRDVNRHGRRSNEMMIWPQTNLASLAAMVEKDYETKIYDCIAVNILWDKFEDIIKSEKPDYVVIEIISSTLSNDLRVATLAKKEGAVTIGVGPHVTELPRETLLGCQDLDFVMRGEMEITTKELIDHCEQGVVDFSQIKGIGYLDKGVVVLTEDRPFVEDLNSLPVPAFHLLPLHKYRRPFLGKYIFIVTSRGCPFPCTFCRQIVMFKGIFRQKSPARVVEEIKELIKYEVTNYLLHADTFTVNKAWVLELCDLIQRENLNIRWACNTHIKSIDREIARAMKGAGCWMIAPGIESGSQEILNNIKKGVTLDQIRETINMLHEEGLEIWAYFVFGFPGETKETIKQSIRFSKELPIDIAHFGIGAPYPGTEFYNMCKKNGWLKSEKWEDFDQNYSAIVEYPNLISNEISSALRKAYISFYLRPRQMKKIMEEFAYSFSNMKMVLNIAKGLLLPVREKSDRC